MIELEKLQTMWKNDAPINTAPNTMVLKVL